MGKQDFIRRAQRNSGQSDLQQLIELANYIRKRWHLDFEREWYFGFDKEYGHLCRISETVGKRESKNFTWRNPDLHIIHREFGIIIIELDGSVHDKYVEKTEKRNELFRGAGIKLIVINIQDCKNNGITIEEKLDCEMTKLLCSKTDCAE